MRAKRMGQDEAGSAGEDPSFNNKRLNFSHE